MPHKVRTLLPLLTLIALTLACSLPSQPEPAEEIGTQVAQTLAAAAGEPSPTPEPAEPTAAPEDTEPAPPTETSLPPTPTPTPTPVPFHLVYVREGDAWLWTRGGSPAAVTSTGDVVEADISDDGQRVALVRKVDETHEEIWVVNPDGSNLRSLVSAADFDGMTTDPDALTTRPSRLDWVPGSYTIVFNTYPTYMGPGYFLNNDLRLVDADSGAQTTLLPPDQGGEFYYSPDGTKIAVVTPTRISVVNADGTNRRDLLTYPTVITYSEYNYYPRPVWTPDGSALRVVIPPEDPLAEPRQDTNLWHLPADGSPANKLFTKTTIPFFVQVPRLTSDTQKIAYLQVKTPGDDKKRELHLANADGSEDRLYATGPLIFHEWSPNGNHFIYSENGENPKVGKPGEAPTPISGTSRIRDVKWINNREYLYLNRNSGIWELWIGSLDTSNALIASSTGDIISYDFIPASSGR